MITMSRVRTLLFFLLSLLLISAISPTSSNVIIIIGKDKTINVYDADYNQLYTRKYVNYTGNNPDTFFSPDLDERAITFTNPAFNMRAGYNSFYSYNSKDSFTQIIFSNINSFEEGPVTTNLVIELSIQMSNKQIKSFYDNNMYFIDNDNIYYKKNIHSEKAASVLYQQMDLSDGEITDFALVNPVIEEWRSEVPTVKNQTSSGKITQTYYTVDIREVSDSSYGPYISIGGLIYRHLDTYNTNNELLENKYWISEVWFLQLNLDSNTTRVLRYSIDQEILSYDSINGETSINNIIMYSHTLSNGDIVLFPSGIGHREDGYLPVGEEFFLYFDMIHQSVTILSLPKNSVDNKMKYIGVRNDVLHMFYYKIENEEVLYSNIIKYDLKNQKTTEISGTSELLGSENGFSNPLLLKDYLVVVTVEILHSGGDSYSPQNGFLSLNIKWLIIPLLFFGYHLKKKYKHKLPGKD